jgi:hypothetical protein
MRQDTIIDRRRVASAIAAMTLIVPLAGTGLAYAGDNGKGDERPESAPGQQKKQEDASQAPAAAQPGNAGKHNGADKSKQHATPKSHKGKAHHKAKSHGKADKPANTHAKAGKTTICHSTGSATNPYVTITVSNNALKAHARHHDGRDIIPAPAEGCPKGAEKAKPAPAAKPDKDKGDGKGHGHAKVTICHATGSETNPYVTITIAEPAVAAHRRHQHGEDIIPAPAGGCPAAAIAPAAPTATATPTETKAAAPAAQVVAPAKAVAPAAAQAPAAAGGEASLQTAPATANGDVLGEEASGGSAPAAAAPATTTRESGVDAATAADTSTLPFTGLDLWLVVAAGLAALVAGIALFRASGRGTA